MIMKTRITIPAVRFAADDEALKKQREALRIALLEKKRIPMGKGGNVTNPVDPKMFIPKGILASDDEILKKKREELKKRIANAETITVGKDGNVMGDNSAGAGIRIPTGKLALDQWYEKDPGLLYAEKTAMANAFPEFELTQLDDGRLAWTGMLNTGIRGDFNWYIMAVYNNNHPTQVMGSSVRVYLIDPDINELIQQIGWQPTHLLSDSSNQLYLCTAESKDIKVGAQSTSAASVIAWAVKWIMAFELVMTGDLPKETFNAHGGI